MSSPITLTPAGMTLSGSYLFNYPKDAPSREVEALLNNLFPQSCWDWTKHDGEANVFLHKSRLVSWLLDGASCRHDDLSRQRLVWEATMLPLTPEAVRLALKPPPKSVIDPKTKTVAISMTMTKTYIADLDYDTFVGLREMEFDPSKGTKEEFDAKMLPLWLAFLKKHKKGITLEAEDEGEVHAKDEEDFCLIDRYDKEGELEALVNQ